MVTAVGETIIQARTVTTQVLLNFDRQTGVESWGKDASKSRIDSVKPLHPEIFDVMLGLDRKFWKERPIEEYKLSDAEKKWLIFVYRFYKEIYCNLSLL